MINVKDNYKSSEINTKYEFCESDDITEHLFECSILLRLTAINIESEDKIQELRRIARYIERVNEIKNKIT